MPFLNLSLCSVKLHENPALPTFKRVTMKAHIFTFNAENALQPQYWVNPINLLVDLWIGDYHVGVLCHHIRAAKYIRVKILEGWGKKFAQSSSFGVK